MNNDVRGDEPMATILVDGKQYEVNPSNNLLHECLQKGIDIPYFCWHPAMGSIGSCRQCAVKQYRGEEDTKGAIVMSCMVPAADGVRISVEDEEAAAFRRSVIEWLMTNHPHDCPVCDEGGECHLQDMTVMAGHTYRRFRFKKRTYTNQYLGPLVNHEMNRCIQCYRCVRFYKDYAHGDDFDVFGIHSRVYFGRHEDGVLQNEFSGNLVEVCPTGVFTDKTLKQHYTRKWDMTTAPSICTHCSVGCNTIAAERYGGVRRILNRYHGEINGYFLCDRGRYGYDYVNGDSRVRTPLLRTGENGGMVSAEKAAAIDAVRAALSDRGRILGVGSPRASVESNVALMNLVGGDRYYSGLSESDSKLVRTIREIYETLPVRIPTLKEIAESDAVFVLGEDVTNTAPMMALALRQSVKQQPLQLADRLRIPRWQDYSVKDAIQHRKGPFYIANVAETKLDDIAADVYRGAPDDIARLGFAVAALLDTDAPKVKKMDPDIKLRAKEIANALKRAARPLIVTGTSLHNASIIRAAANVAAALRAVPAALCCVVPEVNTMGAGLLGGGSVRDAMRAARDGSFDTLIVVENDLYRREDRKRVDEFLQRFKTVVVLDHLNTATAAKASVVLPAGTFGETDGTFVNYEGRAQRYYQVYQPADSETIQESWRWLRDLAAAAGYGVLGNWRTHDDAVGAVERGIDAMKGVSRAGFSADFRIAGMKLARATARYSGRTAIHAGENIHEQKPPDDPDAPFTFTMEGFTGVKPGGVTNVFWAPRWNSVQALTRFQEEIGGPLRGGDPGIRLLRTPEDADSGTKAGRRGKWDYFNEIPAPFERRPDELYAVPAHHIFGSDELSIQAPWLRELAPHPYVLINGEDAADRKINEGDTIMVRFEERSISLPVKTSDAIPRGVTALPEGLQDMSRVALPAWIRTTPQRNGAGDE
jgi:NADH-quinone oxidoreductase subunit G